MIHVSCCALRCCRRSGVQQSYRVRNKVFAVELSKRGIDRDQLHDSKQHDQTRDMLACRYFVGHVRPWHTPSIRRCPHREEYD